MERELGLEFGLELDLDDVCEREADVGRELGREFGNDSALVTLDKGAKIPEDAQNNLVIWTTQLWIRLNDVNLTRVNFAGLFSRIQSSAKTKDISIVELSHAHCRDAS